LTISHDLHKTKIAPSRNNDTRHYPTLITATMNDPSTYHHKERERMPRAWTATTMIAVTAVAGVSVAVPSSAAEPDEGPCAKPYETGTLAPRVITEHLASSGAYGPVRAAAMTAIQSPRGEIAITEFIPGGWCAATKMMDDDALMNAHIIASVLAIHSKATSPYVWAAATAAAESSDPAVQEDFVRHGLEHARANDQRVRDAAGVHAAKLRQFDRNYVAQLADDEAQSEHVRIAAGYAVEQGDSGIVDFYTYAWARFSRLDVEQFKLTMEAQEVRRFHDWDKLQQKARRAAQAAKDASEKAQAADAWAAVAAKASDNVSTWRQAQDAADRQYKFWQSVYSLALSKKTPSWKAMTTPARVNRGSWFDQRDHAGKEITVWEKFADDARRAEEDLRPDGL
jgi:hypothetical protein